MRITIGPVHLFYYPQTAKTCLYSLGGADGASLVDNLQYLIVNRSPPLWHFESEFLGEQLLNVQHELNFQQDLG